MKKKTLRRLEISLHAMTAALLLLKSFDELKRTLYFPAAILASLALVIIALLFFWRRLKIRPREARTACYYVEAPALLVTAYLLYLEQKEFLTYVFVLAAFLYPATGIVSSKKFKRMKKTGI